MKPAFSNAAQGCHAPLQSAIVSWAARDDFGGFASAAATLFPGWTPKASCRAPHREDRSPSFSLYRGARGEWRFKDHATGEGGGLVGFVMLAGMDAKAASRWLMERTLNANSTLGEAEGRGRQSQRHEDLLKSSSPSRLGVFALKFQPYSMPDAELRRCISMAEALLGDHKAIARIANARGWKPETIRNLAMDPCLGLHDGHPVMIYPTGAKKRLKPLAGKNRLTAEAQRRREEEGISKNSPRLCASAVPFLWMFGKPHSLWRGDRLMDCTERVHITEGETDAINLIDAGFEESINDVVMAVPGASSWRDEWAQAFRGLRVTLWPDPDAAGQSLIRRMAASLSPFTADIQIAETHTETTHD